MSTTIKFKTNLNCGNCVAKVAPSLDAAAGITSWSVDTNNPDKILTIESDSITIDEVLDLIEDKGFDIELLED